MSSFKDLRIVDNFYQTSLFFPMPTVLISTLAEDGSTSLGPYSLVQPYYVGPAVLCSRQGVLRNAPELPQLFQYGSASSAHGKMRHQFHSR